MSTVWNDCPICGKELIKKKNGLRVYCDSVSDSHYIVYFRSAGSNNMFVIEERILFPRYEIHRSPSYPMDNDNWHLYDAKTADNQIIPPISSYRLTEAKLAKWLILI